MTQLSIGILGSGYSVPDRVRFDDDPIFDWVRAHTPLYASLFKGYRERRSLGALEALVDLMVRAGASAVKDAGVEPRQIDALYGSASVGRYTIPNDLFQLHQKLGLRADAPVIPIQDEFTNFMTSLAAATDAIAAGRIEHALIACGCNWTQHVDYHEAVSVGIGDGAGAVVVGRLTTSAQFALVDTMAQTNSELFGIMGVAPRALGTSPGDAPPEGAGEKGYTRPLFYMAQGADKVFTTWGYSEPPALVERMLDKHGLRSGEITLITHQASETLLEAWRARLGPRQLLTTMKEFGNMTLASIPVTLSSRYGEIASDHLVLLGLGHGIHATAALLRREAGLGPKERRSRRALDDKGEG
jgi:3-oxoacyl-[acyl-carrier-protein] synthase-3